MGRSYGRGVAASPHGDSCPLAAHPTQSPRRARLRLRPLLRAVRDAHRGVRGLDRLCGDEREPLHAAAAHGREPRRRDHLLGGAVVRGAHAARRSCDLARLPAALRLVPVEAAGLARASLKSSLSGSGCVPRGPAEVAFRRGRAGASRRADRHGGPVVRRGADGRSDAPDARHLLLTTKPAGSHLSGVGTPAHRLALGVPTSRRSSSGGVGRAWRVPRPGAQSHQRRYRAAQGCCQRRSWRARLTVALMRG
ncbi:hypothetical protein ACFPRL_23800 [Pseudoclavibacter helvolus]